MSAQVADNLGMTPTKAQEIILRAPLVFRDRSF
jgi:antitoxin component of RelBE/YafQ-DinJ toxin-antitoxin module